MNDKNVELVINIYYKNQKISVKTENIISLERLKEESMNNFDIKNELKEYIIFTFKDEQEDINILENIEDIIKNSKEIYSEKLLLELNLEIYQENKRNIINNEIKEVNYMGLEENKILKKQLIEKDNKIKELNDTISNLGKDYTKKINKMKFSIQNKSEDINNENKKEKNDKFIIKKSNENNEKDLIINKINNLEIQMTNILSQIKEINKKITKMTTIISKEEKNYEKITNITTNLPKEEKQNESINNKIQGDIKQNNKTIKKDEIEYFNENSQKEKEIIPDNNKIIYKKDENINKNENVNKNEIDKINNKEIINKEKETNVQINNNNVDEEEEEEDGEDKNQDKGKEKDKIKDKEKEKEKDKEKEKEKNKDIEKDKHKDGDKDKMNEEYEDEESEESDENEIIKEDKELTNLLKQYFFEEKGDLNQKEVTDNELKRIGEYYKDLLSKNKSIENIKIYQANYIFFEINPHLKNITEKFHIENRIRKINNIFDKIKVEKKEK